MLLAGCSSADPVWVAPPSPAPSAAAPAADRFVAAVRQQMPEVALDRRDEEITDLGDEACASIRDEHRDTLTGYGVTPAQARQLIGVARAELCPG